MVDDILAEEWRPVEGWPYEVSSIGRVRRSSADLGRTRRGRIIRTFRRKTGHRTVVLCSNGRTKNAKVHRLMCRAFHGPPPSPGHLAAHENGDPGDNRPDNIYWATPAQNSADMVRHGRSRPGGKSNLAVLSDVQALSIIAAAPLDLPGRRAVAAALGVTEKTVTRILRGETFKHLSCPTSQT